MNEHTVVTAERLDQLARRLFGTPSGYVEAILDLNPGLAEEGLILPVGRVIKVPREAPAATGTEVIRLWT